MKTSKLLANNWVITLSATLIGVFLALYLNEWVASQKFNNQKEIATKNISDEILANQKHLTESITRHTELLGFLEFSEKYMDDEKNLIAPADSMNKFRNEFPNLITIKDSTRLSNGNYKYKGETNYNLSLPHLDLSSIAWETLKNSGISSNYDFECLMYLEKIDKLTIELSQKDGELLEFITGSRDSGDKHEKLIAHLTILIVYENMLNEIYGKRETELKNCD